MKRIISILFAFAALGVHAQIDKHYTALPDYVLPNIGVVHTIKVDVTNNYDTCKFMCLRNNQEVTGIDLSGSDFTDPVVFVAEYISGTLLLDPESWLPEPFGVWFKILQPGATFTIYFQSKGEMDIDRLLDLIRISKNDFCNAMPKATDALGWEPDEIIIPLPLPGPDAE